jgi:hypothetical protein
MKTIWLVPLEKIETRYTYEWADHIPAMIEKYCAQNNIKFLRQDDAWHYAHFREYNTPEVRLVNIEGDMPTQDASTGAFINFASTNVWKSSQAQKIADHFHNDRVQPGDVFYFTDAWNPAIIQVRYMSDLLDIPVTIVGQWHAGWHDPNDFLGRKIKSEWAPAFEASLFHAIDINLFTTEAYIKLFFSRLRDYLLAGDETQASLREKILRVGYPNSYLFDKLAPYSVKPKENIILFPHRIAPEKQIEIFYDLENTFANEPGYEDYKFIVCQEKQLTKPEYHDLLGRSKLVFSAALQETYGIAQTEAIFAGAMSLSPDRLSYSEMYFKRFLYPSEWTLSFESYLAHKEELVNKIKEMLTQFDDPSYGSNGLLQQSGMLMEHYIGDTQICYALTQGRL